MAKRILLGTRPTRLPQFDKSKGTKRGTKATDSKIMCVCVCVCVCVCLWGGGGGGGSWWKLGVPDFRLAQLKVGRVGEWE